jgi:hypothetical protein
MRRPAFKLHSILAFLLLAIPFAQGCATGGRDARDVANDLEGPVSSTTVDRLLRDVDLQHTPVSVSMGSEPEQQFGPADQQALETLLREAATSLSGDRAHVTQQVVEDTANGAQQLTVTVSLDHSGEMRYVPMVIDLVRDGRRVLVTHVRIMSSTR